MTFAKRLRALRKEKGLTQKELGEKIGVGRTTISEYESGKIVPRQDGLIKLAEELNVTVDYLTCNHEIREIIDTLRIEQKPDRNYNVNIGQQIARTIRILDAPKYDCYIGNTRLSDKQKEVLKSQLKNVLDLMFMITDE